MGSHDRPRNGRGRRAKSSIAEVRDSKGDPDRPFLRIRCRKIRVLPPIRKQKRYPALTLTVIHAEERRTPKSRKKIDWKLISDLRVGPHGRH